MNVNRYPSPQEAVAACTASILKKLTNRLAESPTASIAISGGSSPKPMFELFAQSDLDWSRLHVFWVDERAVPPTDPRSNYKLALESWLGPAKVPEANIHRIRAEFLPERAALEYSLDLERHFGAGVPRFDVIHLGMGPDAHTASLFPGEPMILNQTGVVAAVRVEKMHQWRVTLLPATIRNAASIAMLVLGVDKQDPLKAVLRGPDDLLTYPAQLARLPQTELFTELPED